MEKISIGNNAFVNDLQQSLYTGSEIIALIDKKLIWFDEIITNNINWLENGIDTTKKYAFRHIDAHELLGEIKDDLKDIELLECEMINKYEFQYVRE